MAKSESIIWVSAAYGNPALSKNLVAYPDMEALSPEAKHFQKLIYSSLNGDIISDDELPKEFFGRYHDTRIKSLPDFFKANGFLCVSSRVASVFREFDLEENLYPVHIWQGNRKTKVGKDPFYLLMIKARKQAFLPDHSKSDSFNKIENSSSDRWSMRSWVEDDDTALSANVLEGASLWRDPSVTRAFFLDNELLKALRSAKIRINLKPKKCRLVEETI